MYKLRRAIHKIVFSLFYLVTFSVVGLFWLNDTFGRIWAITWIVVAICAYVCLFDAVDLEYELRAKKLEELKKNMFKAASQYVTGLSKRIEELDEIIERIIQQKKNSIIEEKPFIIYDVQPYIKGYLT